MLISQILKEKGGAVYTVEPTESVGAAASLLHTRGVGAMVVCQADKVVGILSERDVVRLAAEKGEAALRLPVSEGMTRDVVFAKPNETVDDLLGRMTDRRVRHLPVLENGRLSGIVSIGDLVKYKISEIVAEADGLKAYIAAG